MIASLVLAACLFAGWVPFAVYTTDIKDLRHLCEAKDLPNATNCNQLEDLEHAMTATTVSCVTQCNPRAYLGEFPETLACIMSNHRSPRITTLRFNIRNNRSCVFVAQYVWGKVFATESYRALLLTDRLKCPNRTVS